MTNHDIECIIWCPTCKVAKFEVTRTPTSSEGIYVHVKRPLTEPAQLSDKHCDDCMTLLERKPDG